MVIEMLSLSPTGANGLNCADFLILILRLIGGNPRNENEDLIIYHLATLKMLLQRDFKELAIKHNAMNILIEKLDSNNDKIKMLALDCIAVLCHESFGRLEGADKGLGLILCKKLHDPSFEVKIKVAGALAFATIQSETRKILCKKCIVDVLMEILENYHFTEGQLASMKVLSNLFEDPDGKPLVAPLKKKIKKIFTNGNVEVERHKGMLINLLKKKK